MGAQYYHVGPREYYHVGPRRVPAVQKTIRRAKKSTGAAVYARHHAFDRNRCVVVAGQGRPGDRPGLGTLQPIEA
jgi:hypothetical protein